MPRKDARNDDSGRIRLGNARLANAKLIAQNTSGQRQKDMLDFLDNEPSQGATFRTVFFFIIFMIFMALMALRTNKDFMTPQVEHVERTDPNDPINLAAEALRKEFAQQRMDDASAAGRKLSQKEAEEEVAALDIHELSKLVDQRQRRLQKCESGDKENCKAAATSLTLQYNQLSAHVEKDFYKVLHLDPKNAEPRKIRAAYEEAKQNPDISSKELAQIKEARDLLLNPETRLYWNLYGQRPPESMRGTSARSGGWGVEWMSGTFKYKFIDAWLRYFNHSIWAQIAGVGLLFGPLLLQLVPQFWKMVNMAHELEKTLTGEGSDED